MDGHASELHDRRYGDVAGICFGNNASELIVAYCDGSLRIWNPTISPQKLNGDDPAVEQTKMFSLSADGNRVGELTCRGQTIIWNTSKSVQIANLQAINL